MYSRYSVDLFMSCCYVMVIGCIEENCLSEYCRVYSELVKKCKINYTTNPNKIVVLLLILLVVAL